MAVANGPSVYSKFDITSNDGKTTISLIGGVIEFQYFEDLFSPIYTAKVRITSTGTVVDGSRGVFNGLPIRGGEKVIIGFKTPIEKAMKKKQVFNKLEMYVNGITNVTTEKKQEVFDLHLVSKEAFINEQVRVPILFKNQTIDKSVAAIMKYLGNVKIDVLEPTENSYNFFGNLRKPFTLLTMLAKRSIPVGSKSKSAGFFFWQTHTGFNFLSPDGIIKAGVQQKDSVQQYRFVQTLSTSLDNDLKNATNILNWNLISDNNVINNLTMGEYSSHRMFFDPLTFQFLVSRFSEESKQKLGRKETLPDNLKPDNIPANFLGSRQITQILDRGTFGGEKGDVNTNVNDFPGDHIAQSITRYSTIMTQQLALTVPINTNLNAGDVVNLYFPDVSDKKKGKWDDQLSGLYIIKEMTHYLLPNQSYTAMRVIRDTHGFRGKPNG
jgi:hypothetical protein|tara:strand:+ start:869 stop:2182 length:1314 start_codon:yes stop_codon:yes gene_type:complete